MSHTLQPDEDFKGHEILIENGLPKFCPYMQPMIIANALGQPVAKFRTCGTWCALFKLHKGTEGNKSAANLTCASTENFITIEPTAPQKPLQLVK